MDLFLKNKRVVVSASTDGIGKAIAEAFLNEGAFVLINGRNEEKLESVLKKFNAKYGDERCIGYLGDLSRENEVELLKDYVEKEWAQVDILICNLGSGKGFGDRYSVPEWDRILNINLLSAVSIIKALLPLLDGASLSSIVCLSSIVSHDKIGAPPAYAASKAGINALVKYLADDVASKNIRVNGVAPGNVFYKGGRWNELQDADPEGVKSYIETAVPMKRFARPEEIADVVLFLASERSSFITGAVLDVDGGQSRGY